MLHGFIFIMGLWIKKKKTPSCIKNVNIVLGITEYSINALRPDVLCDSFSYCYIARQHFTAQAQIRASAYLFLLFKQVLFCVILSHAKYILFNYSHTDPIYFTV